MASQKVLTIIRGPSGLFDSKMAASEWSISYEDHMKLIAIHHQMLNRTISGQFLSTVKDQKVDVKQMWGGSASY